MFHPDSDERRRGFVETMGKRALSEVPDSIPRKHYDRAFELVGKANSSMDLASESAYGVFVAGELLLLIMTAAKHSPTNASLARAIYAWRLDQKEGKTYRGDLVGTSQRSVETAWARFRPVAHLCGAWELRADFGASPRVSPVGNLRKFLATAEALRTFGETHHPPAGRTGSKASGFTTLDPMETWHLPTDLKLPKMRLKPPPPTEFVKKAFAAYRA
jgi:hypothetical protein